MDDREESAMGVGAEHSRWGHNRYKGKNKRRKFKEQPAGQWGWGPARMDKGRTIRWAMPSPAGPAFLIDHGKETGLELQPQGSGEAAARKGFKQESD